MQPDGAQAGWRLGSPQPLYPESAQAVGVRWLVLAQAAPGALQSPAFEGDAGRLLDNMLRAARLHQGAGAVVFAPLVRQNISGAMEEFTAALTGLMAHVRPDAVLVMGRLAAQALLASSEPLGKLRGQPHTLHGRPAIVTYDAPYLLRCPHDKAKAWDDLCLAVRLAAG
ncbi:MAG: phage polymerase-related protein [Polaromonas sp.]|nr:phage polymerase-related protein [Polaromonas sp.]